MSTPSDERPDAQSVDDPFLRGDTVERPAVRDQLRDEVRDDADERRDGMFGFRTGDDLYDVDAGVEDGGGEGSEDDSEDDEGPHPVAVPLAGFFTGMAYVLLLPVLWFWGSDPTSVADLLSADLVFFVPAILIPVGLAVAPRTRRFGRYMLGGVLLSAVVVVGVAAIVLAVLIFTGR